MTKDAASIDATGLAAFAQYSKLYNPWEEFRSKIATMSKMPMEIFVAEVDGQVAGAIGLVKPPQSKDSIFEEGWAVIRMLVVDPKFRGNGIGRILTEKCIQEARDLNCGAIGLHTSPIMEVALSLYLRMGFEKFADIPDIYSVAYGLYKLELN